MKPSVFRGWFTINQGRFVTPLLLTLSRFHVMIPNVSGNVDGHIKGVETCENVQTQHREPRLGFVLMVLPDGFWGFHSIIRAEPSCFTRHKDGPDKRSNASREPSHLAQRTCQMVIQTLSSITLIGQTDQFAADWQMQVARAERILSTLPTIEQTEVMQQLKATIEFGGNDPESRLSLFVAFNDTFERGVR